MNIIKTLRKTSTSFALAFLMLFSSCSQYESSEIQNQSFNNDSFEFFKRNINLTNYQSSKTSREDKTTKEISQEILSELNSELNINLEYPEKALDLIDFDREQIIEIALDEGWISQMEVDLNNQFFNELQNSNFESALTNFESKVLNLELNDNQFMRINTFVNTLKSINYYNPDVFKMQNDLQDFQARSFWGCAGATFALTAATAGLASCATVVACAAAIALHIIALSNFGDKCLSE